MNLRSVIMLRRRFVPVVAFLITAALSGCHSCCLGTWGGYHESSCCDRCSNITPGALPDPQGDHVRRFQNLQITKADAADYVFYTNEWRELELGPFGEQHLAKVLRRLPHVPYPVVLQPEYNNTKLNEARKLTMINHLAKGGITDAPNRVVIAYPDAEGLDGNEAERTYFQYLLNPGLWGRGRFGGYGGGFGGGLGGYGGFGGGGGFGGMGGFGGFGGLMRGPFGF